MLTAVATLLAALAVSPVAAQWNCGGNQFSPESVQFSDQCSQAVQACVTQFSANASQVNCQDSVGDLFMQQQASGGNNSYSSTAFKDILDFCLSDGWTTGTWYQDGQWYWMATEWACYNVSMPTIPADLTTPVQQRIAFSSEKAISIGWNTFQKIDKPCVQYGLSSEALHWKECSDSSVTYPTSRTYSNVVTLANLAPATTYYYKIESTNSTIEHFLSPRKAGDNQPFTMAAVIDLGAYGADGFTISGDNSKRDTVPQIQPELNHTTIWQLAESVNNYEFVIHPGDFAYADNWANVPSLNADPEEAYESILEQFYDQLAPIAGRKPYMVSPGNHDAGCTENNYNPNTSCPVGQKNFTDFMIRFGRNMPTTFDTKSKDNIAKSNSQKAQALANPPFWYSFDYGMVHFVMINTETDFPNSPDQPGGYYNLYEGPFGYPGQQLDFVEADLASVDRSITPWVLVGGHRTWYSTGGSGNICAPCQVAFEELMYKYGVDLGIFGHVHNAQRQMPLFNGTVDPNGMDDPKAPLYIVAGGAGNIEGLSAIGTNTSYNAFAYASEYTFATISFLDKNNLKVDFICSSTGEILDSSILYKSHKDQFVVQEYL